MSHPLLDRELHGFGRRGLIAPFCPERVNPASYNLGIGQTLLLEHHPLALAVETVKAWLLGRPRPERLQRIDLAGYSLARPYRIRPGAWALVDVQETITIPEDHEAQVILRSSAARAGWDHALAGYVDPGYQGRLTLEFVNCRRWWSLPIFPGVQLVQLRICRLSGRPDRPYSQTGRYHNAEEVEACKDARLGLPSLSALAIAPQQG